MANEHLLYGDTNISDRAKHRLRIAARFLRLKAHRFNDGNFYTSVIRTISQINGKTRDDLCRLVDWVEQYELVEIEHWGRHGRSRARKNNNHIQQERRFAPCASRRKT
jgi:hypothetical protein